METMSQNTSAVQTLNLPSLYYSTEQQGDEKLLKFVYPFKKHSHNQTAYV